MSAVGPQWDHRGMRWQPEHDRCPECGGASIREEVAPDAEFVSVRRLCRGCGNSWLEAATYA